MTSKEIFLQIVIPLITSLTTGVFTAILQEVIGEKQTKKGSKQKNKSLMRILYIMAGVFIAVFIICFFFIKSDFIINDLFVSLSEVPTTIIPTTTPTITPTPTPTMIAEGKVIREIKFSTEVEGELCRGLFNEKRSYWDYEYSSERFFINPDTNGYMVVCKQKGGIKPEGSLQIEVEISKNLDNYGYGLLFGWRESNRSFCRFVIKREGKIAYAFFTEGVEDNYINSPRIDIPFLLEAGDQDLALHTIRMVLKPNREVIGYFDGKFVASYKYDHCEVGDIGFIAYGNGNKNIYFDNLVLRKIP